MKKSFLIFMILVSTLVFAQDKFNRPDWENGEPEACTTLLIGKKATYDGSTITTHTDDSHRDWACMKMVPAKNHPTGSMLTLVTREKDDSHPMPRYKFVPIGKIPQVEHTYGYINTNYPSMNEHQLAIGEATFGGREELYSDKGLIDCYQLCHLIMQRCKTAREAIDLTEELLAKYGWRDYGECLTIADPNECWYIEIVGPGKDKVGATWVAVRIPDGHATMNANASRIRKIDLDKPEQFRASENVFSTAIENGWWNTEDGEFEFCYAYASRSSFSARRREWRVLSMLAPSLELSPNAENFPFSVKPDTLVTKELLVKIYQDYYEDTPFDMTKNLLVKGKDGKYIKSPVANPFMHYDMNKMLRINGGWDELGERTIARWYTMYGTITQSRSWLPNEVGGVVWLAWDNVATSIYVPIYNSVTDVPESYKVPGRKTGYTRTSAWWGFNRLSTIAAHRWGEMRHDVGDVWNKWQAEMFLNQSDVENKAAHLLKQNKEKAVEFLTDYTNKWGTKVYKKAWELGDFLWTKYDEKF
ncbi:MAG: dipeptidase [Rhodothermaceae bacterium]